jgi:5'-AMP-activated protein kinase, catalytic alpha subunit
MKIKKLIKEKLKATNIPDIKLKDNEGEITKFSDLYTFEHFLGTGTFGFVVAATDNVTKERLAIKIVEASQQNEKHSLVTEAKILEDMGVNEHVIEFKFIKKFKNYMLMGIEYAKDKTLLELTRRLHKQKKRLTDEECSKIVKSILLGLRHIHRCNYVHRDMKPSNVVISNLKTFHTKLVDFGLAVKYQTTQGIDETCGTLVY